METGKKQAKKSLFVLLLILVIGGICGTAEAVDDSPRAYRRSQTQIISAYAGAPSSRSLTVSNPYWSSVLDAAGFADYLGWGMSPRHPYYSHEMLSGEWGAAIYYDGISTAPKAMWLTDKFLFPDWSTNSNFQIFQNPNAWDDPCNPVIGNDTGYSVIRNGQVEVRIDYEMVDLGVQDPNTGEGGSPLAFRDVNGSPVFVYSERYVLLQTYTIKNIKASGNITGLEFYQLLHGHGANDYGPVVYCSYQTLGYPDALAGYTPYNVIHRVGNFLYDITQWNNLDDPAHSSNHVDWVGFSCTVEPNVYECNYYPGHSGRPASGAHVDIENRVLDANNYSYGETAGAMGWYLGILGPNESVSITLALMPGAPPIVTPPPLELTKVDDVNGCVGPGDEINYRIDYNYPGGRPNCPDIDGVNIIDELPEGVDFVSANFVSSDFDGDGFVDFNDFAIFAKAYRSRPGDANWNATCDISMPADGVINNADLAVFCDNWLCRYDPGPPRIVIWNIGTLHPGDEGFVTLKVKVKPCVEPGTITNCCKIKSGEDVLNVAYEYTPVCSPTLTKVDNVPEGSCVAPDDNITYSICYDDANGYSDTNVVIDDNLPIEVDYVSSDPCGVYHPDSHKVTWDIGTLGYGASNCITLIVKVNESVVPGGTIKNCCVMTGDCMTSGVIVCEYTPACGGAAAPKPNPMWWADVPAATGPNTITMRAVTADDNDMPCQYLFTCTTDGTKSSGWITSSTYEATGLTPSTVYSFKVRARDSVGNTGIATFNLSATTDAVTTPPVLRLDLNNSADNNDANTQTGFLKFIIANSGSEVNGVIIDLSGNITSTRRDDPCGTWEHYDPCGGLPGDPCYYSPRAGERIYRDNIYGISPSGVTITLWGLGTNRDCNITIWAYDACSTGGANRVANWYANGTHIFDTDFIGGSAGRPGYDNQSGGAADLYKYAFKGRASTDNLGRIVLTSTRGPSSPASEPFAFVNALKVEPNSSSTFITTKYAYRPVPPDSGAQCVPVNVALKWRNGAGVVKQDLYFGTNSNDVSTATRASHPGVLIYAPDLGTDANKGYDPTAGFLQLDTTYYWRVDENDPGPVVYKGEVWGFTTCPNSVVDNFDEYAPPLAFADLKKVWKDYTTQSAPVTDAVVYPAKINHNGVPLSWASMQFVYENDLEPYYSEARAAVATARPNGLGIDPDWLDMGAKSLTLWFYGEADGDANHPMYVTLTDSGNVSATVKYDGDMNNIRDPAWHEWDIDLAKFTGVNLANVKTITIGIGDGNQSDVVSDDVGHTPAVYFDDIQLYK